MGNIHIICFLACQARLSSRIRFSLFQECIMVCNTKSIYVNYHFCVDEFIKIMQIMQVCSYV